MTPVGGGVHIEPSKALDSQYVKVDLEGGIDQVRGEIKLENLAAGQWWWD